MTKVIFIDHKGNSQEIQADSGSNVMQAAVDNMIDGILGDCGGSCSCATCHCYVDEQWINRIAPPSDMENDLLPCVQSPTDKSRLSCQIIITDELDGMVIRLPESQY